MSTSPSVGRPLVRALVVLAATAAVAATSSATTGAAWGTDPSRPDARDSARGLSYAGLVRATHGPCVGGFEIHAAGRGFGCTHGPDPAPAGVDVTRESNDIIASSGTAIDSVAVPCIGDGTSGTRVQAVYAVASDRADRYATVAPQIVTWAGQMENAVEKSAQQTGGTRYLRFVTTSGCALSVAKVVLSPTGDDSFGNTIAELRAAGFDRADRKYVIWADAVVYCGIGQAAGSDVADASNSANSGPNYGRVDTGCWNRTDHSSALHELLHTLGAVQPSAPHATALFHCTDESDAMCYSDAAGVTTTQTCPVENEWLLDCGNDDYFSTSPAAGSYLATHWNTASSAFLSSSLTATDPVPPPAPAPTTTTVSDSFSGSITSKKPVATFSLTVGGGSAASTLAFTASGRTKTTPTLKLRVLSSTGTVLASGSGPSVLAVAATLPAGSYRWEVSGSTSVSFTLTVTHVAC